MELFAPLPIAVMAMTELIPIMMPSMVRMERMRLRIGRIDRIAPAVRIDDKVRVFDVEVRLDAQGRELRPVAEPKDIAELKRAIQPRDHHVFFGALDHHQLGLTERLRKLVPKDVVLVAESGIHGVADARRMLEAGADAILVGEALMRSPEPAAQVRELCL